MWVCDWLGFSCGVAEDELGGCVGGGFFFFVVCCWVEVVVLVGVFEDVVVEERGVVGDELHFGE